MVVLAASEAGNDGSFSLSFRRVIVLPARGHVDLEKAGKKLEKNEYGVGGRDRSSNSRVRPR